MKTFNAPFRLFGLKYAQQQNQLSSDVICNTSLEKNCSLGFCKAVSCVHMCVYKYKYIYTKYGIKFWSFQGHTILST